MNKNKVTSVIKVSSSKSLSSCINYLTKLKPKYNDNGNIKSRVLDVKSENLFDNNIPLDYKIMKHQLYASGYNGRIHCIRLINSFRGLNYKNKNDVRFAEKLNNQLIHRAYGNHAFVLSIAQCDNYHHLVHFHSLVLNGPGITHKSRFYRLAKINHRVLRDNGLGYYSLNNEHKYHVYNGRKLLKNVHKTPNYSYQFKPAEHFKGRLYFPKIFHGKSIISILKSSANKLRFPKDYSKAQSYLRNDDNKEEVKAIKLNLIDTKIATIKSRIANRNQIRQMRIAEIKRERGLSR